MNKSLSLVPTCVPLVPTYVLVCSVVSSGLEGYGWGDSGVTSESWVWRESIKDNGSRSGQLKDA